VVRPAPEPGWQEGAGGLLLLAAAHETGLLTALEAVLPLGADPAAQVATEDEPTPGTVAASAEAQTRLAHLRPASLRMLLLTLLFMGVAGVRRTWDLRGYTGEGLALLSGRRVAYGYRHTERFLVALARAGGAATLTAALAAWTAALWRPGRERTSSFYRDGHRKAVHAACLIPRGLVARFGAVLGCRALVLLHDAHGHPLLVTTHRGDLHLTTGAPQILAQYQQASAPVTQAPMIIDREGMAAEFLAALAAAGQTVVTLLRSDQYTGLASFTEVGAFVPMQYDRQGRVVREVAPARFQLARPDHPDAPLPLCVALIRDLRWQVAAPPRTTDEEDDWQPDPLALEFGWGEPDWQATPAPAALTQDKLIPIVTTAPAADAIDLARTYIHRWPAQENVIKDWLIPLGIDTNHGYGKAAVRNSEIAKKREALERRLAHLKRWAVSARQRSHRASLRSTRLWKETKEYGAAQYRLLEQYQQEVEAQDLPSGTRRLLVRTRKVAIDDDLQERWARYYRVFATADREYTKAERYCREQRTVLRALEDLALSERDMYELDNAQDQAMTVCKVALANLGMWVRDQYFPASYAQATWHRLLPFFRLSGRVIDMPDSLHVELRPFNDRGLNGDLAVVCARVAAACPRLPDGRRLVFTVSTALAASLPAHHQQVA
jgi:hypothetical protein